MVYKGSTNWLPGRDNNLNIFMLLSCTDPQCNKANLFFIDFEYEVITNNNPTRAYFWPAVNKRPTLLWPRYFLTRPKEILLTWSEKSWKIWHFRGNFPNPNQRWLTQTDPSNKKLTQPRLKTRTHHYPITNNHKFEEDSINNTNAIEKTFKMNLLAQRDSL